jgi:hypothetical protein
MTQAELEELAPTWFSDFPPEGIRAQLANFAVHDDGTVAPHLSLDHHMTILRHLWEDDPDAVAEELSVPVRVVAVGDDPAKRARVERFAGHLRDGRVIWSDGHHDLHAQRPQDVVDVLLDLSAEVSL